MMTKGLPDVVEGVPFPTLVGMVLILKKIIFSII
jgi:hypothetical protein